MRTRPPDYQCEMTRCLQSLDNDNCGNNYVKLLDVLEHCGHEIICCIVLPTPECVDGPTWPWCLQRGFLLLQLCSFRSTAATLISRLTCEFSEHCRDYVPGNLVTSGESRRLLRCTGFWEAQGQKIFSSSAAAHNLLFNLTRINFRKSHLKTSC